MSICVSIYIGPERWRHVMGAFSALLTFWKRKPPPVTNGLQCGALTFSFVVSSNKLLNNRSRSRCFAAPWRLCDVTVIKCNKQRRQRSYFRQTAFPSDIIYHNHIWIISKLPQINDTLCLATFTTLLVWMNISIKHNTKRNLYLNIARRIKI